MRHFRFAIRAAALVGAVAASLLFAQSGALAQICSIGGANSANGSGLVAGAQAGYNWQQGGLVYGLETDLSATGLQSSMTGGLTSTCVAPGSADSTATVDWYGTLRGRLGFAADKALFYGTAGLAYGQVDLNSNFQAGGTLKTDDSSVRTGWVAGGGIDYMLQPNLILNLGYQYVDLGNTSASATVLGIPTFTTQTEHAHAAFHVVTLGLSWRFAPGPAPWSGGYVGGHAGGAWGLNSDASYDSGFGIPSDRRLKRDVALLGILDNGLGLYRFRYLWSDTVYVGVMAQEVALIRPDAVIRDAPDGYLRVDYAKLGLRMVTWPEWQKLSAMPAL